MDLSCLNPMPAAGTGLHGWIAQSAAKLVARGFASEQIEAALIARVIEQRGAYEARREVRAAVESAIRKFPPDPARRQGNGSMMAPIPTVAMPAPLEPKSLAQIAVNWDRIRRIALDDASPDWLNFSRPATPRIWLERLFAPGELVCCSLSGPQEAKTKPREDWVADVREIELVVPSPMSAPRGLTQDGRVSVRCLDNTAARRWLVIEFDFQADKEGQPVTDCGRFVADLNRRGLSVRDASGRILNHLRKVAPMALAVWSGNKSLHGWFHVEGQDDTAAMFMRLARSLGADPATWTQCQMVRFPDGLRHDRNARQVVGFNDLGLFPVFK